ncbi:diguanylate cyclase [Marinobacter sp. 2_MG-2023]|uniref:diguanylate cyclase n=1 Tax=Marinobacter sp. 2_MG-2023 TaxID=3062679 RepID=UPI0026E3B942|nr:diguanylate cyclase [Marinobacter sp. 2_MG-2023]MDO6441540.1 diguanylate cyclase [Marinobacter sp. 2_MG-2023]
MPQSPTREVQKKLETLRNRFRDKTIREIEGLVASIFNASRNSETIGELVAAYQLLHRLAGSAGTLGFTLLGEQARKLEIAIKPLADQVADGADSESIRLELKQLLSAGYEDDIAGLGNLLVTAEPVSTEWHQPRLAETDNQPVLLILEPDQELAELVSEGLALYGHRLRSLSNGHEWPEGMDDVDLVMVRDTLLQDEGVQWLSRLHDLPVICFSQAPDFATRYRLACLGIDACCDDPQDIPALADRIEQLLAEGLATLTGRVMILDDDRELLEHYRLVLTSGGLQVRALGDPSNLLSELSEFRPDILLMDVQMGLYDGPALARMVRFQAEWLSLPIIFFSSEEDRNRQLDALARGGDDFVTKPVSDEFLLRTVRMRCYRARQLDKLVSLDSLTGLLKHALAKTELGREYARSARSGHNSVVAMLDLDHFKKVNDAYGHGAGDMVIKALANLLRHRLRNTDIIGRYGGEEFMVVLPECSLEKAVEVLEALSQDFARLAFNVGTEEFSVSLSAGVATLNAYGSAEQAIEAADRALYQRKRAGRNGVSVDSRSLL